MKTLSTTNSIEWSPLRYGLLVIPLLFAFLAMPGTARGQMFASVNANPFTNGGSFIYQYDPTDSTGTYTTFFSNLDHPRGLAFDSAGNLFVGTFTWDLDSDGNILGISQAAVLKVRGGVTSTFATFFSGTATALATDTAGNVFVSSQKFDDTESIIYKVTPDGTVSTFGTVPGQCFGLAFDNIPPPSGPILFAAGADSTLTYGSIYEFAPGGVRSIFVGQEAFSSSPGPVDLAFDASGNLFASISDGTSNSGIVEFAPDGTESTFATGLTKNPRGLAFDSVGNLFVAESGIGGTSPPFSVTF
jgi:sugar lactone lactonase YvrE